MDLRGMLNTTDGGDASSISRSPAARPGSGGAAPLLSPLKPPSAVIPGTPGQAMPPQSFRDYNHAPQASPGRSLSHDYAGPPHTPSAAYPASPPPQQGGHGPYGSRHAPPPLQPPGSMDARSPIMSGPAPSPYRHTPGGSLSGPVGAYPFPPTQPLAGSPVERHQYPPAGAYPLRESFSQPSGPGGITGPPGPPSYMQGQPMPQTPPVGTPGGAHIYPHQRSHSTHSTPTPTSAHSQSQYGAPYVQGSPVLTHHPPPHQPHDQMRHPSQPPPAHVAPIPPTSGLSTGQRAQSAASGYSQPQSPYQQRAPSLAPSYPPLPQQQAQGSPPPPPSTSIPRSQSTYDAQASDIHRRSRSHSEQSVSPKTRKPSIPSSAVQEHHEPRYPLPLQPKMERAPEHRDRAVTPAKRKIEDRDLRPDELEQRQPRRQAFEGVNGDPPQQRQAEILRMSTSPQMKRAKRPRRKLMPVWAKEYEQGGPLNSANFVLRKPAHISLNGTQNRAASNSRQQSPESVGREANSHPAPAAAPSQVPLTLGVALLQPWEPSIQKLAPHNEMARALADFLYLKVVGNAEIGSIQAYGAQLEIEAKFGTVISKDTLSRVELPITTETILHDTGRYSFKSSMTEAQHKAFNEFLNETVLVTNPAHPDNAGKAKPRVQVQYKHRREIDRFFELPLDLQEHIPPAVRSLIPRHHTPKLRVTYDQKTRQVLAKIVKVRVADLSIHFPTLPLDCRVSVNLEMAWEGPVEEIEARALKPTRDKQPDRNKDRLSYTQGPYQIDLTQVTQTVTGVTNTPRQEKEHELEIELAAGTLIDHGRRAANQLVSGYPELVEGFLDNIRVLARKARDFATMGIE